jgi:5-methylcytosine-specific restriction enzyme A
MSPTPKKPCNRCKTALTTGALCAACQEKADVISKEKTRRYDQARGTTTERGYGTDWQKVRAVQLREHPVCQCDRCREMGRVRPADTVHHIQPVERAPELRLDPGNLLSMGWGCHEAEEGRSRDKEYDEWVKWGKM